MINFHKVITGLMSFIHGAPRSRVRNQWRANIVSPIILPRALREKCSLMFGVGLDAPCLELMSGTLLFIHE